MAPYLLAPDEALVITGRWPECRFASVALWTRYLQTYDYAHRTASLNRASTTLEPDGTFRMVLAHDDPGVPNWIDTEGKGFGMVFWRFFLPEGEVETPQATVVKLADVNDRPSICRRSARSKRPRRRPGSPISVTTRGRTLWCVSSTRCRTKPDLNELGAALVDGELVGYLGDRMRVLE